MITYTIVKEEDGDVLFAKTGDTHEFTLSAIKENAQKLDKLQRELTAQIELEKAKMVNVEEHHKIVTSGMSEEEMAAISVYYESMVMTRACEKKMEEVKKAQANQEQTIADIKEQTGYEC